MRLSVFSAFPAILIGAVLCGGAAPATRVAVTGMVAHPGAVALAALPQQTVAARFQTRHGTQAHQWRGPALLDVLNQAGITDAPGGRTHLRHVILLTGADGYAAALALGEIDPQGEGKQVIVALTRDGTALPAPCVIVPGDRSFARGVHDLAGIELR